MTVCPRKPWARTISLDAGERAGLEATAVTSIPCMPETPKHQICQCSFTDKVVVSESVEKIVSMSTYMTTFSTIWRVLNNDIKSTNWESEISILVDSEFSWKIVYLSDEKSSDLPGC